MKLLPAWLVLGASLAYLLALFGVAAWADRRAAAGRSVIGNAWVYTLSMGVYCSAWTYFGSVGRAAQGGVWFLPIYLGPTLAMVLAWLVLRKMVRIARQYRITSIADFIASRYGKSRVLAGAVTLIALVGVVPYVALQLKAVAGGYALLTGQAPGGGSVDGTLIIALVLAAFTIAFGTRHLDATERHEGLVAAIATESVVKLLAFLAVGAFVTWGLFGGVGELFARALAEPAIARVLEGDPARPFAYDQWFALTLLAGMSVILLPRQFQVMVVENVDEGHIRRAAWAFPAYLLLINLFVLPITAGGLLFFGGAANAETFVLSLPLAAGLPWLALAAFIGGLSAATGMVIVETIALSTMVSNSLVLPVLLRRGGTLAEDNLGPRILRIRRATIVALLLLGYLYFRVAGASLELVSIGLISFAAVAQFAPAVLGGLYWRRATRRGATWGLVAGFVVWAYTLPLPSLAHAGLLPSSFVEHGPFGIELLAPYALFGLDGLDSVSHSMLWSWLVNIGLFVGLSLTGRRDTAEHVQASMFTDPSGRVDSDTEARLWRGSATVGQLEVLLARFLGAEAARNALQMHAARTGADIAPDAAAGADLVRHVETLLAGAVGSASARFVVASVVDEEPLAVEEVLQILDETSEVLAYSRALERKSQQLQQATTELREANERLQELDRLKDEFVSTVSHELRTPLTSIRAFSEILSDNPDLEVSERGEYLQIIVSETERLTRLINQILDLSKLESGGAQWEIGPVDLGRIVQDSIQATAQIFRDRGVELVLDMPDPAPTVSADPDRLVQVVINLLSNAVKFCPPRTGRVEVTVTPGETGGVAAAACVSVRDNGPGVAAEDQAIIFEKFRQGGDTRTNRPAGTGLGLPISREIIDHLGGQLWVHSRPGEGAAFSFTIPLAVVGSHLNAEGGAS